VSPRSLVVGTACSTLLLCAAPARTQVREQDRPATPRTRAELFHFAELLDLAVGRVSRPSPFQLMGPSIAASGYLLPGYGAIFVLPTRALPAAGVIVMQAPEGTPVVGRLRRNPRLKPAPVAPVELPGPAELQGLDRDMQQIENLVVAYAREAELQSREAEEQMERMAAELRMRFPQLETPAAAPKAVPGATPPPPAPAPPVAETAPVPVPVPAAPWRYWFHADLDGDSRSPDQVVSEVRGVLIQELEARGGALTSVRPDDFLVVAVDFAMRGFPMRAERRSERTLVLRAKKRDLDERRSGKLTADELRKRIQADEY
jgi:hypothetical protein